MKFYTGVSGLISVICSKLILVIDTTMVAVKKRDGGSNGDVL